MVQRPKTTTNQIHSNRNSETLYIPLAFFFIRSEDIQTFHNIVYNGRSFLKHDNRQMRKKANTYTQKLYRMKRRTMFFFRILHKKKLNHVLFV